MKTHRSFPSCVRPLVAALLVSFTATLHAQVPAPDFVPGLTSSELFPPLLGTYDLTGPIQGPPGMVIEGFSIRLPDTAQAPPVDVPSIVAFTATIRMSIVGADGGVQDVSVPAVLSVEVTPVSNDGTMRVFDTEMLQLNVTSNDPEFLLRESPTLRSQGGAQFESLPDGTFRIGSFFDIFTELSVDGGRTWVPAAASSRATLGGPVENTFVANTLPPATGTYAGAGITFANGVLLRKLAIGSPEQSQPPPPPGGVQVHTTPVTFSGEMSSDGGATFEPFRVPGMLAFNVRSLLDSGTTRYFDTEMLALSISGAQVMLRESPTRASTGRTSIRLAADGTHRIASFFDVFTELSLDGGQSWSPAVGGPCVFALPVPPPVAEHFFRGDCFPAAGTYETAADAGAEFQNGVVIRNFRYRPAAQRSPLPQPGAQQTRELAGTVELEFSRDGGGTFARHHDVTFMECFLTGYSVSGSGGHDYPMESLSLNFTLPGGVMVRESPTRASTGRTSIRAIDGGHMIGSFFDIFTEVSLDGGQSWTPANGALHASLLPYVEQDNVFRTEFHPPRDGSYATRRYAGPVSFQNGTLIRDVRFEDFTKTAPPPAVESRLMEEEGIFYFFMSTDGGKTWAEHRAPARGMANVAPPAGAPQDTFDTEMLSLDISGGTLPPGVMLRESPARRSLGRIGQEVVVDSVRMDSFFDVFTELSVDGGTTWLPSDTAARLELHAKPAEVFNRSDFAPFVVQYRESDFNFASFTGNVGNAGNTGQAGGIRAVVIDDLGAQLRQPPPATGQSLTQAITANVSLDLTLDSGQTFTRHAVAANGLLRVRDTDSTPDDGVRTFDTEMLALDLSGGPLPPGVMLRESPTLPSPGHATLRAVAGGFAVSSFFDIFTELSLDGGQTWTPLCDPIRIGAVERACAHIFASDLQPPAGVLRQPSGVLGLACATGEHLKEAKLTRLSRGGVHPPDPGSAQTVGDAAVVEFLYSTDEGQNFVPVRAPAYFQYELKNVLVSGLGTTFDTEMLAFDASGGSLPPGVMLRESPTRASTGKTSIVDNGDGTHRIASFFDVFIELSTDGGGTWQPMDFYLHLELENTLVSSFAAVDTYPPAGVWSSPPQGALNFASGSGLRGVRIFRPVAGGDALPAPGETKTFTHEELCRIELIHPGSDPVPLDLSVTIHVEVTPVIFEDTIRLYDTGITFFSVSGDTLPSGVMLRESPTLPSKGRMSVETRAGGGYRIDSFFDIFTEISTDGGATWSPSDGPLRLEFAAAEPPTIVMHPSDQRVLPGAAVAFTVDAEGPPPLSYQWLFKGRPIPAQTSAMLKLPAVQAGQSGFYSVVVTNPGGSVVSESAELLVVRRPFTLASGNFNSLVLRGGVETFDNAGLLKLKLTRTGSFTGTLQVGGLSHLLRGSFDMNGDYRATIARRGLSALAVNLHIDLGAALDLTNPRAVIAGTIDDGSGASVLGAERTRFLEPLNPAVQTGTYTALMPRVPNLALHQGNGFAAMRVKASGAVTIEGRFVNGLTFSYGGFVKPDGTLPFFIQYGNAQLGSVGGTLTFRDIAQVSDCDGVLTWLYKLAPPLLTTKSQEVGFVGSRYVPPPPGTRVLHFANTTGNAEIVLGDSSPPFAIKKILTVSAANKVTVDNPGADKLSMGIAPKTGLFTGSFIESAAFGGIPFKGAVLQKQDTGGGVFVRELRAGFVDFGPR